MLADGRCRSCNAQIKWVMTTAGKRMPLDPIPVEDGNCYVDHWDQGMPVVVVASGPGMVPPGIPIRYESHFATCKDADSWRRKKG